MSDAIFITLWVVSAVLAFLVAYLMVAYSERDDHYTDYFPRVMLASMSAVLGPMALAIYILLGVGYGVYRAFLALGLGRVFGWLNDPRWLENILERKERR